MHEVETVSFEYMFKELAEQRKARCLEEEDSNYHKRWRTAAEYTVGKAQTPNSTP